MGSSLYRVEKVGEKNENEWEDLFNHSPQRTPFAMDGYLNAAGFSTIKYLLYRKEKCYAGLCLPVSNKTGEISSLVPFAPYQGLIYSTSKEIYTDYHNNLEATEVLLDYLYDSGEVCIAGFTNFFTVKDMRAIQWHHYHEPELGKYDINIWYTSVKDIDDSIEDSVGKRRDRDYKNAKIKNGLLCEQNQDIEPFIKLYEVTFKRQGIVINEDTKRTVEKITQYALTSGIGELWYAVDDAGNYIDATLFLYLGDYGYYLFGANDPDKRDLGGATLLFIEQMKMMKKKGIRKFDFIGVNSPYRGDYKLSFGGSIYPYYECKVKYTR